MTRNILSILILTSIGCAWAGKNDALAPLTPAEQEQFDLLVVREHSGDTLPYAEYKVLQDLAPRAVNDVLRGVALAHMVRVDQPLTDREFEALRALSGKAGEHLIMDRDSFDPGLEGTLIRLSQRFIANFRKSAVLVETHKRPLDLDDACQLYRLLNDRRHGKILAADAEAQLVELVERQLFNLEHAGLQRGLVARALTGAWGFLKTHAGYVRDGFWGGDAGSSAE